MARHDTDSYDSFSKMLNQLKHYKKYESFSAFARHGRGYKYDLMDKTASGLLYDAIATTSRLTTEERKHHEYAQNVLAAFVMHHCVLAFNYRKYFYVDEDLASRVINDTYKAVYKMLKQDFEAGKRFDNVRKRLRGLARKIAGRKFSKQIEAGEYILEMDENGKRSLQPRNVSIDEENEDGNVVLSGKVIDYIIESAEEQMRKEKKLADLADAIMECRAKKILSDEEILILCHTYGLGEGYEIMKNGDIAELLGHDDSYVTRHRKEAIEKLRNVLNAKK